jgi:hypothetical protein
MGSRWLLLIHSLPPKPDYLRVKVRRRLERIGAAPLRGSVYVLPATEESREDFQWLLEEIRAEGGAAILCEASFLDGITDEEVSAMLRAPETPSHPAEPPDPIEPGRTWVTRKDVGIDRMASAWLIRKAIDREARFKFVAARGYRPAPGELRFDMFEAEYTHVGDRCSFQTLLDRFGITDRAFAAVGEIVRDIDCKDTKYGRPETAGIAAMAHVIVKSEPDDERRLARGGELFEGLLAHFSGLRR